MGKMTYSYYRQTSVFYLQNHVYGKSGCSLCSGALEGMVAIIVQFTMFSR